MFCVLHKEIVIDGNKEITTQSHAILRNSQKNIIYQFHTHSFHLDLSFVPAPRIAHVNKDLLAQKLECFIFIKNKKNMQYYYSAFDQVICCFDFFILLLLFFRCDRGLQTMARS